MPRSSDRSTPTARDGFAAGFLTAEGRRRLPLPQAVRPSDTPRLDAGSLALRLAGVPCALVGLGRTQAEEVRDEFADYLLADASQDLLAWTIELRPVPGSLFRTEAEVAADGDFWDYFLDLRPAADAIHCAGIDFFAHLYRAPHRRLVAWVAEGLLGSRLEQAVHNLLRLLTAFAVVERDGLLLHSATLLTDRRAVVCPGRSGAGKSTVSGRARELGWRVLSDELNVLWLDDETPTVEQVPFTGDLGRLGAIPGRFPVAAVLPIVRTGRDETVPLSPADFYSRVLAQAVFANCDPHTLPILEATVGRLCRWADQSRRLAAVSFTPGGGLDAVRGIVPASPDVGQAAA